MVNQQGPQNPNWQGGQQNPPWSNQGNWNHQNYQGPPPGYGPQPQPKKSKKKGCLFGLGAFILLIIVISAINSGNSNEGSTGPAGAANATQAADSNGGKSQQPSATQAAKNTGPSFQGKTEYDISAKPGEKLQKDGVSTISSALELTKPAYTEPILCTKVNIENGSKKQAIFNVFDWKLQDPSGTAKSPTFVTPEGKTGLSSGEIAPGGKTEGYVCFDAPEGFKSGQYVALFEPSIFSSGRHAWVTQK